jgi:hypothetical protein
VDMEEGGCGARYQKCFPRLFFHCALLVLSATSLWFSFFTFTMTVKVKFILCFCGHLCFPSVTMIRYNFCSVF